MLNFNNGRRIPVSFGKILLSEYAIENGLLVHLTCLIYVPYHGMKVNGQY